MFIVNLTSKSKLIIYLLIAFIAGFILAYHLASDNITTQYGCNQIARFHADLLMRKYGKDLFYPEKQNSLTYKAYDLNQQLLQVCNMSLEK